ncbi:MAG: hypothetical protein RBR08_08325 [Desulforegulaceae bacterium]|nr:hypothetical protein [Desulforegulaceae bacterium]
MKKCLYFLVICLFFGLTTNAETKNFDNDLLKVKSEFCNNEILISSSEKENDIFNQFEEKIKNKEKDKKKWEQYQKNMENDFNKGVKFCKSNVLTFEEIKILWDKFLKKYSKDNPYSNQDEKLRQSYLFSTPEIAEAFEKAPPMIKELVNRYSLQNSNIKSALEAWNAYTEFREGKWKDDNTAIMEQVLDHRYHSTGMPDAISDNFKKQEPIYPILVELYNEFMDPTDGYEAISINSYAEKDSYIYYFGKGIKKLIDVTKPRDDFNTPNFGEPQDFRRIETNLYKSLFKVINPNNEVSRTQKFLSSSLDDKKNQIIEIRDLIKQGKNESGDVLSPIEKTYISYSVWGLNTLYGVITASRDKQQKEEAGNMFDLTYPYLEKELVRKLKILPEISGKPYLLNPNFWF